MTTNDFRIATLPFAALALAVCAPHAAAEVSFRIVAGFGIYVGPGPLVEGSPELFYSVGGSGPEYAFSVTPRGTLTQLAAFPLGYGLAPVISASNERFYGWATQSTAASYAFSVDSHANSLIAYPTQTLGATFTQNLPDGTLFGIGGNISTGLQYLVKSDLQSNLTVIYQFPLGEVLPNTAIYATDGNYYGVSWQQHSGGSGTSGYIYQVTPSGTLTKLYTLPSGTFNTLETTTPILQATDGNFYGVTTTGGTNGYGSVYQLTPSGQFTTIYSFSKGTGAYPEWLIQASDGNLYAASLGSYFGQAGLLSRITTTGQYTALHTMTGGSGSCQCTLLQGSDGIIYGTAGNNGPYGGGDVFALNAGLPKPAPQALSFTPAAAPVGKQVRIWGYNMLKATVSFNGVAATTVHNSGPNYVFATVPTGATTGPITVTTPGGTSTTKANFTVN